MTELNHGTKTESFDEDTNVLLPIAVETEILRFTRGVREYHDIICRKFNCGGDQKKQLLVRGATNERCYGWV